MKGPNDFKPKWKQRTSDTHTLHLQQINKRCHTLLVGDSMMERWQHTPYWEQMSPSTINLGVGGDGIEHLLYRISGENVKSSLDSVEADRVVLMIGTNNAERRKVPDIVRGVGQCIEIIRAKQPKAKLIVYGITYRQDVADSKIDEINQGIEKLLAPSDFRLLQVSKDTELVDHVHLNEAGYEKWYKDLFS